MIIVSWKNNLNSVYTYTFMHTKSLNLSFFFYVSYFRYPFFCRNGKLMAIGDRIGLPDDVSVGYVIGSYYEFENVFESILLLRQLFLFSQNIC